MEKAKVLCFCKNCGKASVHNFQINEKNLFVNSEYPRLCPYCKEVDTFALNPWLNYTCNMASVMVRIKKLEKRVKELEEKCENQTREP